jgi:hypothetical protein
MYCAAAGADQMATNKNLRASQRDKALRIMLSLSWRIWDRCHWCGRIIVWWQKLPRRTILNQKTKEGAFRFLGGFVQFRLVGPRKHSFPVVTVDHVLELSKGGGNSLDNLVLSCMKCNVSRSSPPENKYPNCLDCGREKATAKKKYCYECMIERSKAYLIKTGKIADKDVPIGQIRGFMRGGASNKHRKLAKEPVTKN